MSAFLDERYVEVVHRLALGIEPIDDGRRRRITQRLDVSFRDTRPGGLPLEGNAKESGRWALLHRAGVGTAVDVRLRDAARRYVPRLLRYAIPSASTADALPSAHRIRRPHLFPGANYDAALTGTGLRGQVERDGQAVRWARVEARLVTNNGPGALIGLAHGDERGEFLLLVGPDALTGAELPERLRVGLTVRARASEPQPPDAELARADPLWDLPREEGAAPGAPDPVSAGLTPPATHTSTLAREVDLLPGRVRSDEPVFAFPPS